MKSASSDLFHLIHSLSKAEKRSFSLTASFDKKEKLYITLFNLISKQKKYDEEVLVKKLGVSKSHFAVYKHHLYNLILERTSDFYTGKETQIRKLLTQADFLYSKGLYGHFEKILVKVKTLSYKYEMRLALLEIINMEHRNAWRKRDLKKAEAVMEEDKIILRLLLNQRQYTQLSNAVLIGLSTISYSRNTKETSKIKLLLKNPLMQNEKNAVTFRSKYSLYHTLSSYYFANNNFQKQYFYAKKATELYEQDPEKIKYDTFTYLLSLQLMLAACHSTKKFDESKKYIDKLRVDPKLLINERERIWAWFTFHDTNLNYYIGSGKFEEGLQGAELLIKELHDYSSKLEPSQNTVLDFHIARIYFGVGNYSKCLYWMNRILNEKYSMNIRPSIENNIKLFYLIIHYEKGNYNLLRSLVKITHHELSAKGKLHRFENILLNFLGKKPLEKNESVQEFKELKQKIEAIVKKEKIHFEEFDYMAWIDSKIENKSFTEIIQRKMVKKI